MRVPILLALLLAWTAGCAQASPNPASRKQLDEDDIREIGFQEILRGADVGESCFVSFEMPGRGQVDPPDSFMRRLGERFPQLDLRKGSSAKDPGRPFPLYFVRVEWMGPDKAKAHAGVVRGPLNGRGFEVHLEREKGRWVFRAIKGHWVS